MSIEAVVWAMQSDCPDPLAKLILIGLANHADDFGRRAYPGICLLGVYGSCSPRTVFRKLDWLSDNGFIRLGDARFTDHLPGNKRPRVWDLAMVDGPVSDPVEPSNYVVGDEKSVSAVSQTSGDFEVLEGSEIAGSVSPVSPTDEKSVSPVSPTSEKCVSGVSPTAEKSMTAVSPTDQKSMTHVAERSVTLLSLQPSLVNKTSRGGGVTQVQTARPENEKPPPSPVLGDDFEPADAWSEIGASQAPAVLAPEPPRPFPDQCWRHQAGRHEDPCRDCRSTRLEHFARLGAANAAVEAARRAAEEATRAARIRELGGCGLCDENGWRLEGGGSCNHDPAQPDRNRAGAAECRTVLAAKSGEPYRPEVEAEADR